MADKFNNKVNPSKVNKTRVAQGSASWLKNAAKSLGYSSMDILSDVLPSTIDAVKTSNVLAQELIENVKDMKTHTGKLKNSLDKNVYFELGRNIRNYAIEDLKAGKFYNKERADSFDDDFDLDFDIGDSSDYSSSSSSSDDGDEPKTNVKVVTNINDNNPMVDAVREQTKVVYEGSNLVAEVSKRNQAITMQYMSGLGSQLNTHMSTINDNVATMASFMGDTLAKHASLSATYYNDNMGAMNNILSELKVISQQTKLVSANTSDVSGYKEYQNVLDTVFSSSGMIDIKAYADLVKKQFNIVSDSNLILSSIKGMVSQTDVLGEMAKNPLRFISDSIVKSVIPATVEKAATAFDETFRETMIAGLYQIRNLGNSSNILEEIFGKTFGVSNAMKSTIDKSNYQKDAVAFDGITHRTINDVIPFYLRRMTSVLEGGPELAFNYEKGIYDTVKNIVDGTTSERNRKKLGGLGNVSSDFSEYLSGNYKFRSSDEAASIVDNFNKLLTTMVERDGGINFRNITRKDGSHRDDIADILNINDPTSPVLNIIRGFFQGSDNAFNMRVFGREVLEARAGYDKYMKEVEANPIMYNANLSDNGLTNDAHIDYDKSGNFKSKLGGLVGVDKFGKDIFYYLRETMTMIAGGVGVFLLNGKSPKSRITGAVVNPNSSVVSDLKDQKSEYANKNQDSKSKPLSEEQIAKFQRKGKKVVDSTGLYSDYGIDANEATLIRTNQLKEENSDSEEDNKASFLSKLAAVKPDSAFSKILTKFDNMTKSTSNKLEGYFAKANDALFKLVFGDDETSSQKGGSFINRTFEGLKLQFATFGNWMDKNLLSPMYEKLFGDNGFFTSLKNTQFAKDIQASFKGIADKLFGIDDGQGNKTGGLFSSVVNELKDGSRQVAQFFTGKAYQDSKGQTHAAPENSVFGVFKKLGTEVSDSFRNFIGVEKFDKSKSKTGSAFLDGVDNLWGTVKDRTSMFLDDILGTPDTSDTRKEFSKFTSEVSDGMPKIVASGMVGAGIGLIPSLFVPGGPIGGALIGGAMAIASQSTKIKEVLFGPDVDGKRMGGLISKETQDFFKDNKFGISLGLGAGTLASLGFLPSLFVPGGPIGGALIGGAISMANSSESLSKFLFGSEAPDGTKIESGIADKFSKATGIDLKDGFVNAGIGAGVGLVGSFFLPGGPIVGSLLGASAGLALSADKFKTYLFGDKDEVTGKRSGGMFGSMGEWTKEHLFSPIGKALQTAQINVMGFIKKEMVAPLMVSMIPVKEEFKRFKTRLFDGVNKFFTNFGERLNASFDKHFGLPIGEFLETKVLKPLSGIVTRLIGGIGKIFGAIASSPFKVLNAVADGLYSKHQKEGVEDYKDKAKNKVFKGVDENGNKLSLMERLKGVGDYINPIGRREARYSEKGAHYRDQYEGKLAEMRAKIDADMNRKKAELDSAYNAGRISDKDYKSKSEKIEKDNKRAKNNIPKESSEYNDKAPSPTTDKPSTPSPTTDKPTVAVSDKTPTKNDVKINTPMPSLPVDKPSTSDSDSSKKSSLRVASGKFENKSKVVGSDGTGTVSEEVREASAKSRGISKSKRDSLLVRMDKNLQIIANSTRDQLDGVGKNVYKIRKMMQKNLGVSDDDITGSANKDRKGFFGKIKDMVKHPIQAFGDLVSKPFRLIGDLASGLKEGLFSIVGGVKTAIGAAVSGLWDVVKGVGKVALDLLAVPKLILQMGVEGLKMIGPAVAETLVTGVKVVGKTITTGLDLIGTGIKSAGVAIYEGAKGLGQMVAGGLQGLGHLMYGAGLITKDAVVAVSKGVFKAISTASNISFNAVSGVAGFAFDRLFNRDGKTKTTRVQRVTVEGGFLDKIKSIGEDSPIRNKIDPKPQATESLDVADKFIQHKESQEKKFAEMSKAKAIKDSRASVVASGSFSTKSAERATADSLKNEASYKERLLDGISGIKSGVVGHANNWSSMFGKDGIIGSMLILGLPMLGILVKKILDLFKKTPNGDDGIVKTFLDQTAERDDAGRTDAEGNYYSSNEYENRWGKLGATVLANGTDFITGKGGKISQLFAEKISSKFIKNPKVTKEFASSLGSKVIDENGELIIKKSSSVMAERAAKKINREMTQEGVSKALTDGASKLSSMMSGLGTKVNDNKLVSTFIDIVNKGFDHVIKSPIVSKILSSETVTMVTKLMTKMTSGLGEFILKSGSKFLVRIGAAVAKDGSLVFPPLGAVVKVLFGTADFISGMTTEAGKIFQVHKDDVTFGMRIAAGISKLVVGLIATLDLANEIFRIWTDGISLREALAEIIYKSGLQVSGFLGGSAEENIDNFESKQKKFRESFEEYNKTLEKEGKDKMSFVGYLDMEHESMWSKVKRTSSNMWEGAKNIGSNIWEGTKNVGTKVWDGAKNIGSNIWQGAKNVGSNIWQGAKNVGSNIWEGAKDYVGGIASAGKEFASSVGDLLNILFGPIFKFVSEKVDKFKAVVKETWDGITTKVSEITTWVGGWMSDIWGGVKETAGNIKDWTMDKINKAGEVIGNIWDITVSKVTDIKDYTVEKINLFRSFLGDLWDTGVTKVGEIKDSAVELWDSVTGKVKEFIKPAVTWINDKFIAAKNTFSNIWTSITDGVSNITDSITQGIKDSISKVTGFFGGIWGSVTGFFEDKFPDASNFMSNVMDAGKAVMDSGKNVFKSIFMPWADKGGAVKEVKADMGGEFGKSSARSDDTHQGFSYYSQSDSRWGSKEYLTGGSDRSMAYGGCGPTSLAMIISQLTGELVDPYAVAKESRKRGFVAGANGTSWSAMTELPKMVGIDSQFIGTGSTSHRFNDSKYSDSVEASLLNNKPVILSGNRRSGVAKEDSPFTPGGHFVVAHAIDDNKIMINDPRSEEASKVYRMDDVMKETKAAWSYPQNPGTSHSFNSNSSDMVGGSKPTGAIELFNGALDAFFNPMKEFLFGKEDDDDSSTGYSSDSYSSSYYSQMPTTVRGAIASKTAELMRNNESSNNYAISKNDKTGAGKSISPSIGILQWRGGNAKELMRRMYEKLPNDPDAKYYATQVNWDDDRPWSEKQLTAYRNFMTRNESVSRMVQDQYATEHVDKKILPNVYKHGVESGKISDPRSIVMLADISQTGPAHVDGFFNGKWAGGKKYPHGTRVYNTKVPSGKNEFDHFNSEIRSPDTSYWGKHIKTYKSRFDKSYNALKSWNPQRDIQQGNIAADKGGESLCNYSVDKGGYDNNVAANTKRIVAKHDMGKKIQQSISNGGSDNSILREVVGVLRDILSESRGMNKGISLFNSGNNGGSNSTQQIIIDNSNSNNVENNNNSRYGTTGSNKVQPQKQKQKSVLQTPQYKLAKQISMGIET